MDNIREILNSEIFGKNINATMGYCENKKCMYERYIILHINVCNRCKKLVCGLCVKSDRTKCVICELNDKQINSFNEHERHRNHHYMQIAICNNCGAILETCSRSYCIKYNENILIMSGIDEDCVICRKN